MVNKIILGIFALLCSAGIARAECAISVMNNVGISIIVDVLDQESERSLSTSPDLLALGDAQRSPVPLELNIDDCNTMLLFKIIDCRARTEFLFLAQPHYDSTRSPLDPPLFYLERPFSHGFNPRDRFGSITEVALDDLDLQSCPRSFMR